MKRTLIAILILAASCSKQSVIEPVKTTVAGRCSPSCSLGLTVDNSFNTTLAFTANTNLKTFQTVVKNNTGTSKLISNVVVNLSVVGASIDSLKNLYIADVNGNRISNIISVPVQGNNSLTVSTSSIPAYGTKVLQGWVTYGKVGAIVNVSVSINSGCNSAASVLLTKWTED